MYFIYTHIRICTYTCCRLFIENEVTYMYKRIAIVIPRSGSFDTSRVSGVISSKPIGSSLASVLFSRVKLSGFLKKIGGSCKTVVFI